MYGCESWTISKAEPRRTDAFELWCWRRLLRILWTARRSNQSILKEINPEYSLEGLCWSWSSNTLATWCKELTHWERLKLEKIEGRRKSGQQRMRWHHQLNGQESEHEGGNRTSSILKAGLHLGPDCGLWAICPVSMETVYQLENQAPGRKSPRALHHLKEYPNYLCNRIDIQL